MNITFNSSTIIFFFMSIATYGQDPWSSEQKKLIETMNLLSATTTPGGNGADKYASYLSDDFSRWTVGSSIINNKKKWTEGVREWFDDGWRVSERKQQNIEIRIMGDFAHTRRIVSETYLGPKGDISESKAALAEIWIKENNTWLLYLVNVHPMKND
ncbi:MAG: nuclear transport factor 2 family protein [Flavobacteriaceae bacterium]